MESVMASAGKTRASSLQRQSKPRSDEGDGLVLFGRHQAADHFFRGLARQRRGDAGGALVEFEAAVRANPKDAEVLVQRGLARLGCLDLTQAVIDAGRTVRIDAQEVWAYYQHRCRRPDAETLRQAVGDFDLALERERGSL